MKTILSDAITLAKKDFSESIVTPTLLLALVAFITMVFFSTKSSFASPMLPANLLYYCSPIAMSILYTGIVGDSVLRAEKSSMMIDVLLALKVRPISIILGKSIKPATYGLLVSLLSLIALQAGSAVFQTTISKIEPLPLYLLLLLLASLTTANSLVCFSVIQNNATVVAMMTYGYSLVPFTLISIALFTFHIPNMSLLLLLLFIILFSLLWVFSGILFNSNIRFLKYMKRT